MKAILVAPLHSDTFTETNPSFPFPKWQAHSGWLKALLELGVNVRPHIYSQHLLSGLIRSLGKNPISSYLDRHLAFSTYDRSHRAQRLLKDVSTFQPDILIVSGGPGLSFLGDKVWFDLRNKFPKLKMVLLNGMKPIYPEAKIEQKITPLFDLHITNDSSFSEMWRTWGAEKAVTLPISAIDPEIFQEQSSRVKDKKIVFIGTLSPLSLYKDRVDYLSAIKDLPLEIYSKDTEIVQSNGLGSRLKGYTREAQMIDLYRASAIGLNIHGKHYMPDGANLRTFEIAASGCFQLVDHVMNGLFVEGKEIVSFSDAKDLREKAEYYLNHEPEREMIAAAGQKKAFAAHTFVHRFKRILELLSEN